MRHILVDAARRRAARKHGGALRRISLSGVDIPAADAACEVLDLHRALEKLAAQDARLARVVELRTFAGMTVQETALLLGVSKRTVDGDWKSARLWLAREMKA